MLLRQLVDRYARPDTGAVRFRAVDDYRVEFQRSEWSRWDLLLATRMDGRRIGLREKGPARIVMPYDTVPELNPILFNPRWIWQINQVEFLK